MTRITSRFGYRSTALDVVSGRDLSERFAMVTGAVSGIGLETARALAAAGADVTIAARDVAKAEAAASEIRQSTGNQRTRAATLDLASLASVRRASEDLSRRKPLHILINNAGVMACPLTRTADGFEMQLGTNHLGHFALALLIRPALEAGAPSRVVSLSSTAVRGSGGSASRGLSGEGRRRAPPLRRDRRTRCLGRQARLPGCGTTRM